MIRIRSFLAVSLCIASLAAQNKEKPRAERLVDGLVAGLEQDATWERSAAQLVLLRGKAAGPLATRLAAIASDEDHQKTSRRILLVLDRLGTDASTAADVVWGLMGDIPADVLEVAFSAAMRVSVPGRRGDMQHLQTGFQRIVRLGKIEDLAHVDRVGSAVQSMARVDPSSSVAELVEAMRGGHVMAREVYFQVLGSRGKEAAPAVRVLGEYLDAHIDTSRRRTSARKSRNAVGNVAYGRSVAEAIVKIRPMSKEGAVAWAFLIGHEPFRDLRLRAARELMVLGPNVVHAAPSLVALLKNGVPRRGKVEDHELIRSIIHCLTAAGGKAAAAAPYLERLTESRDEKTAKRARAALERILRNHEP